MGALTVAALVLGAAPSVFACSCVRQHPAMFLPSADAAIVGTVESVSRTGAAVVHVVRVERAIKGTFGDRVTVRSDFTSCQVDVEPGTRVGLFLNPGADGAWTTTLCSLADPDVLLAAAALPPPEGKARLVAAVDAAEVDAVGLTAAGKAAAYGLPNGKPLALAPCGSGIVQAVRGADGALAVQARQLPQLALTSVQALPPALRSVTVLGCSADGRSQWVGGSVGERKTAVYQLRGGKARRLMRLRDDPVAIVGSRAYVGLNGRVGIYSLTRKTWREVDHDGRFEQLAVDGDRVAGRLSDGRAAVLDVSSRRLRTGPRVDALVWLGPSSLLDAANATVLTARLTGRRRLAGPVGRVVGVHDETAYLASGKVLRRLRPGAARTQVFAELPGPVVGIAQVRPRATAAWHSCEESAKTP